MVDERFAYAATLLIVWGTLGYIRDIRRGQVQPNLVTWFLWALAPLIAFAAQIKSGLDGGAMLTLVVGLCPLVVFIVGLRAGTFRPSRFDMLCGAASIVALILWQLSHNDTLAVCLSIAADGLAAAPTLAKAYRYPRSESSTFFALFALSAGVTLLTISDWSVINYAFSLYIFVLYAVLFLLVRFQLGTRYRRSTDAEFQRLGEPS